MIAGIKLRNKANATAEMLIYEDVGAGFFTSGITAQGFLQELRALGDVKTLDVRINSNGGSVFDGIAIYNALRQHPAVKNVYVDGIAASIASVIAMAGDTINMGEGAWMMIHDPSGLAMGTADQMRETADLLDGVKNQLIDIYTRRTGMTADEISALMSAETWMDAQAAIDAKFADNETAPIRIAAHVAANRFSKIPASLQPEPDPIQPSGPTDQPNDLQPTNNAKGNTMTTMAQLQARAAEHQAAAAAIRMKATTEERELTNAERTVMQGHLDEFDMITADIELQNRLESAENFLAKPGERKTQPDGLKNTRLSADSEKKSWGFTNFGEFARSVRDAVVNPSRMDTRLISNAAASTYSQEGVGPDGGFAVPPEYRAEIQQILMGEDSIISQCDSLPTSSNRVVIPTDETTSWQTSGGVLAYWGAEAGTMTQSKPNLKEVNVPVHKIYALVPVTEEMQEDSPLISRYLTNKAGDKIEYAIKSAVISGNGIGQPLGILNSGCLVSVAKETGQAAATIVGANILKMYARQLNPGRSVWLVNSDTLAQILSLNIEFKSSAGAGIAAGARFPTITFPGENGNTFATIMGRPVIVTEACSTVGTVGDIIFADLAGGYFLPYKAGGLRNDVSMHLWFDQGLVAYKWQFRVGGQPWLSAAVTPASGSANTKSSMVALATR